MRGAYVLSRRRFVAGSLALATWPELQRAARAMGMPASAGLCKLNAEQEIGPYYVADELLRSDIREGKPGVPLELRLALLDARTCKPIEGAALDIWHCDALGLYSGYTAMNPMGGGPGFGPGGPGGGPPPGFDPQGRDPQHPENRPGPPEGMGPAGMGPPPAMHPTDKLTFLRGIQLTDQAGCGGLSDGSAGLLHGADEPHSFQGARGWAHGGAGQGTRLCGGTYLACRPGLLAGRHGNRADEA